MQSSICLVRCYLTDPGYTRGTADPGSCTSFHGTKVCGLYSHWAKPTWFPATQQPGSPNRLLSHGILRMARAFEVMHSILSGPCAFFTCLRCRYLEVALCHSGWAVHDRPMAISTPLVGFMRRKAELMGLPCTRCDSLQQLGPGSELVSRNSPSNPGRNGMVSAKSSRTR